MEPESLRGPTGRVDVEGGRGRRPLTTLAKAEKGDERSEAGRLPIAVIVGKAESLQRPSCRRERHPTEGPREGG